MRRAPAQKRKIEPDPVFRSVLVSKVINKILLKGKKNTAREIVYSALETVEQRTSQDPSVVLKRAVDNIRPQVEVRSRRGRWVFVSGSRGSLAASPGESGDPLARQLCTAAAGADDVDAPGKRDPRRLELHRGRREAQGRCPQDGRVEQGVRPLPLVEPRSQRRNHKEDLPERSSRRVDDRNQPEPQDVGRSQPHSESE